MARRRVDTVLDPAGGTSAETGITPDVRDADAPSAPREATKPKSQVPMWREGLACSVLSMDYQRILQTLADRAPLGQGPLTCQEMAAVFGTEVRRRPFIIHRRFAQHVAPAVPQSFHKTRGHGPRDRVRTGGSAPPRREVTP